MAIDLTWLSYYVPIFGFLFVSTLIFAVLAKTKILGESPAANLLIAFIFGIIFVTFVPGVIYVQTIIPWFVILMISLFFLLMIVGFSQKEMDKFMKPWIAWVFIGLLVVIFVWSAIIVFNPFLQNYVNRILYSQRVYGALLLFIVALLASWVLTRSNK
ncbi:MAG: hypothetical protein QXI33_00550 [Candidatus Pacearchaeota archaeon]